MNQYIITDEDISAITDYVLGAFYEGENKEKMYDLIKAQVSVIRSHPYDPQADNIDEWCKLHEEVLKGIRTEAYGSGYSDGEIIGAQSKREKVLDELNAEWMRLCSLPIMHLEKFSMIGDKIAKLRQGEQE